MITTITKEDIKGVGLSTRNWGKTKAQKEDIKKFNCQHLKGTYTEEADILDYQNDEVITVKKTFCKQCHKELSEQDLKNIDILINKFNKEYFNQ